MTCIVGLVHEGVVYIGADSAGVAGYSLTVRADAKAFTNGPFIMGFTGSIRMGQLLRYQLSPPRRFPGEDLQQYMVNDFVDAVRACLKNGGYASKLNEVEEGGTFLVGCEGALCTVFSDYQVAVSVDGYAAVGSGHDIAKGVLYATPGLPPEQRVLMALQAAERFNAGVRGPFHIVSTEPPAELT